MTDYLLQMSIKLVTDISVELRWEFWDNVTVNGEFYPKLKYYEEQSRNIHL